MMMHFQVTDMDVFVLCYETKDVFNVLEVFHSFEDALAGVKEYVDGGTLLLNGSLDAANDVHSLNHVLSNGRLYRRKMRHRERVA